MLTHVDPGEHDSMKVGRKVQLSEAAGASQFDTAGVVTIARPRIIYLLTLY